MPNRADPEASGRGEGGRGPLPWELPHRFLGLDDEAASPETARALILPVPWESTTSYGGGTRKGPRAILEASRYVELHDQELDAEPASVGVHTLPALELTRSGQAEAMAELTSAYARVLDLHPGLFPILLGGEHAVSAPAIQVQAERAEGSLSVLQLDAHADLRASYEGSPWSHASAMARALDRPEVSVVGVGIRAVSSEEVAVARESDRVTLVWADEMWEDDRWMDRALEALGPRVYLTFDVDFLDPSIMPSTGTPEPGGGDWYRTLRFLRKVFREREVVAADVVELAPSPGLHAPDFLVAKLVYKLLGYRFEPLL